MLLVVVGWHVRRCMGGSAFTPLNPSATDGSTATFDDAIQLIVAMAGRVHWTAIATDLRSRPEAAYLGSVEKARDLLTVAELPE
ncbi:MAG: hypothetical protein ACC658_08425 [Acidimicrobiia bacterium]